MKKLVAATAVLAFTLSACGGGGRPSTEDIADSLKSEDSALSSVTSGATDDVIDCIAKELHDSDLSDDALQALVDGDEDYDGSDDDRKAIEDIQDDLVTCATPS